MANYYEQELLAHFRHSSYRGKLESPSWESDAHNPSCGDSISFQGKMDNGMLVKVRFEGKGCVISQSAASLLAEHVQGKSAQEILNMAPEQMLALLKISLGPLRMRCGLLALEALQDGLRKFVKDKS